jgi:hypothetical protein
LQAEGKNCHLKRAELKQIRIYPANVRFEGKDRMQEPDEWKLLGASAKVDTPIPREQLFVH